MKNKTMKTPPDEYVPCYPVRLFNVFEGNYTCESSQLTPIGFAPWCQIWEDSCDVGFWIQTEEGSDLFVLEDVIWYSDGEVKTWIFRSAHDNKTMCKVFND